MLPSMQSFVTLTMEISGWSRILAFVGPPRRQKCGNNLRYFYNITLEHRVPPHVFLGTWEAREILPESAAILLDDTIGRFGATYGGWRLHTHLTSTNSMLLVQEVRWPHKPTRWNRRVGYSTDNAAGLLQIILWITTPYWKYRGLINWVCGSGFHPSPVNGSRCARS